MLKLLNPYIALAAVLYGLWVFGTGYFLGVKHEGAARDARQAAVQAVQAAITVKEDARREAIGTAREGSREQIRTIYTTLREAVDARSTTIQMDTSGAAVPRCELDAAGVQLWNAANAGTAAPLPSQPIDGVSGVAAAVVGPAGGVATEPCADGGALCGLPRQAGEVGGVSRGAISHE